LVLLNGRRVAAHGLTGSAVDVNQIPFAAIDRVEVLKDGASAIYGTDAIGGVINFITKKTSRALPSPASPTSRRRVTRKSTESRQRPAMAISAPRASTSWVRSRRAGPARSLVEPGIS
jgi:outer membrane receptor protein involved in Fe transport